MSSLVKEADFLDNLLLKGTDCCCDFTGLLIASLMAEALCEDFDF